MLVAIRDKMSLNLSVGTLVFGFFEYKMTRQFSRKTERRKEKVSTINKVRTYRQDHKRPTPAATVW